MPNLQTIHEYSQNTVNTLIADRNQWTDYLKTAANLYKYQFHDQLLIYSQRPDATAVASMDTWNKHMNRWVKRGSKAIALIGDNNKIRYVFDVSDTYKSKNGKDINRWELTDEFAPSVAEKLSANFNVPNESDFINTLTAVVDDYVTERCSDYIPDLMNSTDNSYLDGLDELNISSILHDTITKSVTYEVMTRCGYDADLYFHEYDLSGVTYFDTAETFAVLGTAVSDTSEVILRSIERSIKEITYERTQLHTERRLPDTGLDNNAASNEQIQPTAETVPDEPPETIVRSDDSDGNTERSPVTDRVDSGGIDGNVDVTIDIGESATGQIDSPDGVGTAYEQPDLDSGGNDSYAGGVQLSLFPSEQQQIESILQSEIDRLILQGSNTEKSKFRIYRQFAENDDANDNIAFLKDEYGWSGGSIPIGYVGYDGKGMTVRNYENDTSTTVTWSNVEKRIRYFVDNDMYLTPREVEQQPYYDTWEIEYRRFHNSDSHVMNVDPSEIDSAAVMEKYLPYLKVSAIFDDRSTLERFVDSQVSLHSHDHRDLQYAYTEFPDFKATILQRMQAAEETPTSAVNFHITDDNLGHGGAKTKYQMNADAIKTLKQIESENRYADTSEQEILSKYVGWGGIPQAFDEDNSQWSNEYTELKSLLSPEEYESARSSTLNAHYTSTTVIKAMYTAIENMGFTTGNILEPSCGVGNFFGLLPDSMSQSKLYGVELDDITGRIATHLYPKADIKISGFEKTNYQDNFFDIAIGNVPFGSYKLNDTKYDKHNFMIHDYFFAKTLDKVRQNGVIAFVTSKGTLDKVNESARQHIAERADFLGAIRLPDNAFTANAGTEVTTDIIFLQKRERPTTEIPDWVHVGVNDDGIPMNSYFIDHPEMVLGTMEFDNKMYGNEKSTTCRPFDGVDLETLLNQAVSKIHASIDDYTIDEIDEKSDILPADPNVRNFSYAIVNDDIYYRENSVMTKTDENERIRGMIEIRDITRDLIDKQLENAPDTAIFELQANLGIVYENYTANFGLLNSKENRKAFGDDSSYPLLCSLEILDENNKLQAKADMFTKRTIKPHTAVTEVGTSAEALAVSISEKACVDIDFMCQLTGKSETDICHELHGVIFLNPQTSLYETADEYLSGNVREKLEIAKLHSVNVSELESVQPKDLDASEISVRLGSTWIDTDYIKDFIFELLEPPFYVKYNLDVAYSDTTSAWHIKDKYASYTDVAARITFGTFRISAYEIIEATLNLKDVRIYDTKMIDGKEKRILNHKETTLAQQKQELIKNKFKSWIWNDLDRRTNLVRKYNEIYNSTRPREYDGSHIKFVGMNPEISLRTHQVNAVAHAIYGGNTLLAHCVGAGKSFEMTAIAMESKRLGLCSKSMIAVPNHLTEQWASEILRLYPAANVLVTTKKDFETHNRKKFCSRIATGDYDIVVIGHSQFEKIPVSLERQEALLRKQIDDIADELSALKSSKGEKFTVKQLERTKKGLENKLEKLANTTRKDNVINFEELGIDKLFIDEAHMHKNLFLYTKMTRVAGIGQSEAQKSQDLFLKCRYLDEKTNGKGVVFATGTPISNSMTELYTMQRYLQYDKLQQNNLAHFDCWASTFGETKTAIELAPEGTNYRMKTRFSEFYNLPELMNMFKEIADIQTADMLKLPIPELKDGKPHDVVTERSEFQKGMIAQLSERADKIRAGNVNSAADNMLAITNDGRKLALDQRLINPMLPDDPDSKVNACVTNVFEVWKSTAQDKSAQLVFSDLSTPHYDGKFNLYDDIKTKLVAKGVPESEIAFIHDARTDKEKESLFAKVRSGNVRVLIGSTSKMGSGTNCQKRLVALHHLDVPWRPSDISQREGRILRQGNENKEVQIFRYVTKDTFDAYSWNIIENKQKFISQIMTGKNPNRSCEDADETSLSYAEVKALATGNPHIREKMDLEISVTRLKTLRAEHERQHYSLEDRLVRHYPNEVQKTTELISGYSADLARLERTQPTDMVIGDITYSDKDEAGKALIDVCKTVDVNAITHIGSYREFDMFLSFDKFEQEFRLTLKGDIGHTLALGESASGNMTRIGNALDNIEKKHENTAMYLDTLNEQVEKAKVELTQPFLYESELTEQITRLTELNNYLSEDVIIGDVDEVSADDEMIADTEKPSHKKEVGELCLE